MYNSRKTALRLRINYWSNRCWFIIFRSLLFFDQIFIFAPLSWSDSHHQSDCCTFRGNIARLALHISQWRPIQKLEEYYDQSVKETKISPFRSYLFRLKADRWICFLCPSIVVAVSRRSSWDRAPEEWCQQALEPPKGSRPSLKLSTISYSIAKKLIQKKLTLESLLYLSTRLTRPSVLSSSEWSPFHRRPVRYWPSNCRLQSPFPRYL